MTLAQAHRANKPPHTPGLRERIGYPARLLASAAVACGVIGSAVPVAGQGRTDDIAREGQAAPDGNGTYSDFLTPVLNDSGEVAFTANLSGTLGGGSDDRGIFRGSGGAITQIAREGQAAPDGNGDLPPENQSIGYERISCSRTHSGKAGRQWLGLVTHRNRSSRSCVKRRCCSARA